MTHAISSPNGTFTAAASVAAPKLSRKAASTRGSVIECQKPAMPSSHGRNTSAASGISTMSDSQTIVTPRVALNPGSADLRAAAIISLG